MAASSPKAIDYYVTKAGRRPFVEWVERLKKSEQSRIFKRLFRVAIGNFGKVRAVGEGVHELKFKNKGYAAYRIYFGNDGETLIVLLLGGDKSSQLEDIVQAKEYWNDYKQNK